MKTVLITGCSSGYGLETARHFHALGWNVIATMRTPHEDILPLSERLRILPLDVTKPDSITAAIEAYGPADVLVNNAGIGVVGVFEATPMATVVITTSSSAKPNPAAPRVTKGGCGIQVRSCRTICTDVDLVRSAGSPTRSSGR